MNHDETYTREGTDLAVQIAYKNAPDRASLDRWKQLARDTLELIPLHHLRWFEYGSNGRSTFEIGTTVLEEGGGNAYSGQVFRSGVQTFNRVRVSLEAMTNPRKASFNRARYIYTMLHEFGHFVCLTPRLQGDPMNEPTLMDRLLTSDPLGYYAMIRQYHGGGTHPNHEHFADTYANYMYTEVGNAEYGRGNQNLNRGEPAWRCNRGNCPDEEPRLRRQLEEAGSFNFPEGRTAEDDHERTRIRFAALLSTRPFTAISGLTASSPEPPLQAL